MSDAGIRSAVAPVKTGGEALVPLQERLALEAIGPRRWRGGYGEPNQNGHSYGGHLLGLAMEAALSAAPADRAPTMMQFLFRQGARPALPIDLTASLIQQGRRFTSVGVHGFQSDRAILDATVSCAVELPGPAIAQASPIPPGENPDDLPPYAATPKAFLDAVDLLGDYGLGCRPALDHRVPEPLAQISSAAIEPSFRFWLRVPHPLAAKARLQWSALAYLSDWWMNFCVLVPQLRRRERRKMLVSSLNHALWFHRTPRADEWLHVDTTAIHAASGRGVALARFHDRQGHHVATAMQECLTAHET